MILYHLGRFVGFPVDQHEYVLIARFRGAGYTAASTIPDPTITCKLSSRVMEPFFVESPVRATRTSKVGRMGGWPHIFLKSDAPRRAESR